MAKTWIRVKKQFTRRIGTQTVVGHPKHPDAPGRVAEVDEGEAVNNLVAGGYADRISRAEYQKELDSVGAGTAGENMAAQVAGKAPRAAITMSDGQLNQLAADRGVDISKAKNRSEVVKLINAKDVDVAGATTNNAFSRTSTDSRDSTLHPQRTGINADATGEGTTDRLGFSTTGIRDVADGGAEGVADEADAAPAGGGGSGGGEGSGGTGGEGGGGDGSGSGNA